MNAPFQLTTQAIEDLDGIWCFIAEGSREAADRVEMEIIATCRRLAGYPLIGHHRRDITPLSVRFWTLAKYPLSSTARKPSRCKWSPFCTASKTWERF